MPDNLATLYNTLSKCIALSDDSFPDELKSLKYWGFCLTSWSKDKDGNDKLDKLPINPHVIDGKTVWTDGAQSSYLRTFYELGDFPDLQEVTASVNENFVKKGKPGFQINRPDNIYYRFSLGGNIKKGDVVVKVVDAPKIVIFDYDKVIDDDGNFHDEKIKEEIRRLCKAGYVELSASGHGFHAVCMKPTKWEYKGIIKADSKPEVFSSDKFVCLTGRVVRDVY